MLNLGHGETVLLVHEWLAATGGSENCFEQMVAEFPEASTAVLWNDAPARFPGIDRETWLARTPLRRSKLGALPFMPATWNGLRLGDAEVVLASSHMFAHAAAARAARTGRRGYCYVHTPLRYVWAPEADERGASLHARIGSRALQPLDRRLTHPGVHYAANSNYVRDRIRRSWGHDAVVINPCVDVDSAPTIAAAATPEDLELLSTLPDSYLLGVSRMVEYKRLDVVIEVGAALSLPVVIVGTGEDQGRLRHVAAQSANPVHFVGRVSDPVLNRLYRDAAVLVFPPIEDFGIVPVEAVAWGTAVVVGEEGGAREAVERTGGGVVSSGPDLASFVAATKEALDLDMAGPRAAAGYYSNDRYRRELRAWMQQ